MKEKKTVRPTRLPLTVKQVKARKDSEGYITAIVPLSLDELGVSKDCLNDAVSDLILHNYVGLEDISYRPVGVKDEDVLVEVKGDVTNWLEEQDEEQD